MTDNRKHLSMIHRFPAYRESEDNWAGEKYPYHPCPVLSGSCNEARDRPGSVLWRKIHLRQVRTSELEYDRRFFGPGHIPIVPDSTDRYSGQSIFFFWNVKKNHCNWVTCMPRQKSILLSSLKKPVLLVPSLPIPTENGLVNKLKRKWHFLNG